MTNRISRKERKKEIMNAALRIFSEKGFQNSTISEISKAAGVSDATVYEYFGTKEKLLFSIPEKISNESNEELERVLPYIKGVEGRLRAILLMFVNLYETNPHYTNLVLLQLMSNREFRKTTAHNAIRKSARLMLDCIKAGINEGAFREETDPYLIRSILMGTIEHLFIHRHMQAVSRENRIIDFLDPFLEIVFDGIRSRKQNNSITLKLKLEDSDTFRALIKAGSTLDEEIIPETNQINHKKGR